MTDKDKLIEKQKKLIELYESKLMFEPSELDDRVEEYAEDIYTDEEYHNQHKPSFSDWLKERKEKCDGCKRAVGADSHHVYTCNCGVE